MLGFIEAHEAGLTVRPIRPAGASLVLAPPRLPSPRDQPELHEPGRQNTYRKLSRPDGLPSWGSCLPLTVVLIGSSIRTSVTFREREDDISYMSIYAGAERCLSR